jgi:hypothetical protein
LQKNDIASTEKIADQRGKLDLLMQTNTMNHDEKMTYLGAKLAEAKADGDVNRQKTILEFTHGQDLEKMRVENGYTVMREEADRRWQESMKQGDYTQAKVLLGLQQTFAASEAVADRGLESTRIAMAQKGQDFDQMQQTYATLREADPVTAFNFLKDKMEWLGIKMNFTSIEDKAKSAIGAQQEANEYQWGLLHRSDPKLWDEINDKLTDEGLKQYLAQYNAAQLGENAPDYANLIKGLGDVETLRGGATSGPNGGPTPEYSALASKAQSYTPSIDYSRGAWGREYEKIKNPPAVNSIIKVNGKIYQVISGVYDVKVDRSLTGDYHYETFKMLDINTGETVDATNTFK